MNWLPSVPKCNCGNWYSFVLDAIELRVGVSLDLKLELEPITDNGCMRLLRMAKCRNYYLEILGYTMR